MSPSLPSHRMLGRTPPWMPGISTSDRARPGEPSPDPGKRSTPTPEGTAPRQDFSAEKGGSRGCTHSTGPAGRGHRSLHAHAAAHSRCCVFRQLLQTETSFSSQGDQLLGTSFHVPTKAPVDMKCARRAHPHVAECLRLMLGHLHSPRPVCPPQLCGCVLTGLGPTAPSASNTRTPAGWFGFCCSSYL